MQGPMARIGVLICVSSPEHDHTVNPQNFYWIYCGQPMEKYQGERVLLMRLSLVAGDQHRTSRQRQFFPAPPTIVRPHLELSHGLFHFGDHAIDGARTVVKIAPAIVRSQELADILFGFPLADQVPDAL